MKKGLVYAVFALAIASCGNSGTAENAGDTISTVSGMTDSAADARTDTTGLNVSAAQPVDSANRLRAPMGTEPGSRKSGVYDQIDTGTRRGVDTGARGGGE
ncbi:MAG TPA: hypothetical protein VD794_02615 [Flavisolibacter sp.]|nr:hypothetical protein [Flavisolibacter sp.]